MPKSTVRGVLVSLMRHAYEYFDEYVVGEEPTPEEFTGMLEAELRALGILSMESSRNTEYFTK